MTIVFVDHRPFSHFLKNGFRQRVGRVLYHFIQEERIERIIYVWWNEEPFSSGSDVQQLSAGFEKVTLCEARRARVPFGRTLHLAAAWMDRFRIAMVSARITEVARDPVWVWATDSRLCVAMRALADRNGGRLAYDLIDNFAVREDLRAGQRQAYADGYQRVATLAHRIITNNSRSIESLALPAEKTRTIHSGVDWTRFHDAIGGPVPSDIAPIHGPRVGFLGILSGLTDSGLLNAVATEVPECEVVCIGSAAGASPPLHPRIHCLGMKPYDQAASYMATFDVGVSVYRSSKASQFIDSQKAYEYLAVGIPVVTTHAETQGFTSRFIQMAGNATDFVACVRKMLRELDTDALREARSQSVKAYNWRNRIHEILDFLERPLAGERAGR
jgi:glycosyltransferase involved in cell wall biosynthesis